MCKAPYVMAAMTWLPVAQLQRRSPPRLSLPLTRIGAQPTTFKVLYILAYNQMRKRMSVIVEDDEGECWLYVKGADTVLYERLRESESKEESDNKLMTAKVRHGACLVHTHVRFEPCVSVVA